MSIKGFTLTKILSTINNFNESALEVMKEREYKIPLDLRYCINKDTLHSFHGERCSDCSFFEEPYIEISESNFKEFKKHFGKGFAFKLTKLIDSWPKENQFPFIYNHKLNTLAEHKKLTKLYDDWNKLTKNEKINEISDINSLQEQYFKTLNKSNQIRRKINMEFA